MGSVLGWLPARIFGKASGEGARMGRCAVNICPVAVLTGTQDLACIVYRAD